MVLLPEALAATCLGLGCFALHVKRVAVTPAVYPRLIESLRLDIQSTGANSELPSLHPWCESVVHLPKALATLSPGPFPGTLLACWPPIHSDTATQSYPAATFGVNCVVVF